MGWLELVGMALMTLTMLGFWGLLIWGIVALFRRSGDSRRERPDPEQILAQRFAAGEIDEQEYQRRLQTLRSTNRQPSPPTRSAPNVPTSG